MSITAAARAELKWEQTTLDLHPAVGDKAAVAHFKYENVGKAPVHFKSVKASCGCTTTQTQKEVVNPGEKGEIVATFNIGDRTGEQVKQVTVQTDDPPPAQSTIMLTLKTTIPQALEIRPTFVFWTTGEPPKPKKISVKASKDFPAKNIVVKSSNQNFESKVEPGSAEGEWTIEVTPKDTGQPSGTAIRLETDYPKDAPKAFYVNAQITQPQPPPTLRPAGAASPAANKAPPPAIPTASPAH